MTPGPVPRAQQPPLTELLKYPYTLHTSDTLTRSLTRYKSVIY